MPEDIVTVLVGADDFGADGNACRAAAAALEQIGDARAFEALVAALKGSDETWVYDLSDNRWTSQVPATVP